ncbi:hypothetical protein RRG08_002801 [Elysia crispata]|uniref:Ganglioside GM2 activator n=1 Tax=Elysia crispata TaxID=231223 RepID=A0AAE0XUJ3_9GAST|nr:hypothetical protein RRG08_002801 [Elysia crispata]
MIVIISPHSMIAGMIVIISPHAKIAGMIVIISPHSMITGMIVIISPLAMIVVFSISIIRVSSVAIVRVSRMEKGCVVFPALVMLLSIMTLCRAQVTLTECDSNDVDIDEDNKLLDLQKYNVAPDMIPVPGNFTMGLEFDLKRDLEGEQLQLEIVIRKKIAFAYISVPCIGRAGSCKYDLCALYDWRFAANCPPAMPRNNIPCSCAGFKAGKITMNTETVKIPKLGPLWSWLAKGDYKVDLKVLDLKTNKYIGCLRLTGSVRDPRCGWGCKLFGGDNQGQG